MLPSIDNALEMGSRACQHFRMRRESQKSQRRYRITQLIGAVNGLRYKRYSSKQVEPEFEIDENEIEDCTTTSWTLELANIDGQVYERVVDSDERSRATSSGAPPAVPPRPARMRSPTVQVRIDASQHEVEGLTGRVPQQLLTESEMSSVCSSDPNSPLPGSLSTSDAGHSPQSLSPSTTVTHRSREEARNTLSKPELLYLAGVRLDEIPDAGRL